MHRLEVAEACRRSRRRGLLVLEVGAGRLGGFIELSVRARVDGSLSPRVGYVEGWYVAPPFRRQGWGRRFILAAGSWARARGLRELASDSELGAEGARGAHLAVGFRETFRLVHYLRAIRAPRRSRVG